MNPVVPPSTQVCDAPTVSVCINAAWLPFVCGALSQLAQPTTWQVSSQAELDDVLDRVADLISAIGTAVPCVSPPPVLGIMSTGQRACNIAGYLSNVLIKDSIQKAIDAINNNQTVLGYGALIIDAIPGAGAIINAIAHALYSLYSAVSSGTLTDYQDAIVDPALWGKITCAIYGATEADGQVLDTNFAAIQAAVAAVTYTYGEVITTISQYLTDLGSSGLQQLQGVGAFAVYDCSSCGSGVSTGPGGLPTRSQAGTAAGTILTGTGSITVAVVFPSPFLAIPVLTLTCQDPVLIASADTVSVDGFNLTIAAAVNVDTDTTATVDWWAVLPGTSP